MNQQPPNNQHLNQPPHQLQAKKPGCLKILLIVSGIIVGLAIIGSLFGNDEQPQTTPTNNIVQSQTSEPIEETTIAEDTTTETTTIETTTTESTTTVATTVAPTEATTTQRSMTRAQEQAIRTAESYIKLMPFSKSRLINQLEFEKFTTEDATFAVENITVDWMEQAKIKAINYLELMSFSESRLVDQLLFEGYTQEEAEYGASQAFAE